MLLPCFHRSVIWPLCLYIIQEPVGVVAQCTSRCPYGGKTLGELRMRGTANDGLAFTRGLQLVARGESDIG